LVKDKIPSYSAKWLVRRLNADGIPLKRIFQGTNLSEAWLKDDNALISTAHYLTIVNNALDESKDLSLALHLGQKHNLGELGIWGYAIISSPTLGDANQVAIQYWELQGSLVTLSYQKKDKYSIWRILPAFPMDNLRSWIFAVEELISTFFSGSGFLSKEDFQIEEIHLSYPDPGYGSLYKEMFKCPVYFNEETDMFRISFNFDDVPTSMGNPILADICKQQCQQLMTKLKVSDELISSIRNLLITSLGQFPRLPVIAKQLAMSPRTLRRRLQERNITYQNILDEIRIELTKEYIATTNLSIDQIASRIGFSEATTLRRAFKKWTGKNIKEFKKIKKH
jgi:AraC-like DNA-binding protein